MSDQTLRAREEVDRLELPLRLETEEIEQVGQTIGHLRATRNVAGPAPSQTSASGLQALAQSIYRFRRVRDEAFGPKLFSDPRWDILLDLFIAREEGTKISISSICIGSSVPATTALRHLSALAKEGLVSRVSSDEDGRIAWLALTPTGYDKLAAVLRSWSG